MRSEPAMLIALALPVDCSVNTVAATITDSASSATTDSTIPTRTSVESDHTRRSDSKRIHALIFPPKVGPRGCDGEWPSARTPCLPAPLSRPLGHRRLPTSE